MEKDLYEQYARGTGLTHITFSDYRGESAKKWMRSPGHFTKGDPCTENILPRLLEVSSPLREWLESDQCYTIPKRWPRQLEDHVFGRSPAAYARALLAPLNKHRETRQGEFVRSSSWLPHDGLAEVTAFLLGWPVSAKDLELAKEFLIWAATNSIGYMVWALDPQLEFFPLRRSPPTQRMREKRFFERQEARYQLSYHPVCCYKHTALWGLPEGINDIKGLLTLPRHEPWRRNRQRWAIPYPYEEVGGYYKDFGAAYNGGLEDDGR